VATFHEPSVAARSGAVLRIPRSGVEPALADLIDRMMATDPAQRPTIAEVHAALMAVRPVAWRRSRARLGADDAAGQGPAHRHAPCARRPAHR
jgi:hypothetical protein